MQKLTDTQVLERAGLKFDVLQAPVQFKTQKGILTTDPQRFVNYRSDTGQRLGIVSDQYEIVQFKDSIIPVYRQLEEVAGEFSISTQFAGGKFYTRFLLNTNAIVPYNKKNETAKIAFDSINSFDGSRRFSGMLNVLRLICTNLMYAMQPAIQLGGIHMKGTLNMEDLHKLGGEIERYRETYVEYYNKLVNLKVKKEHKEHIITIDKKGENIMVSKAFDNFKMHKGENAWELYNEFTYLNTNKKIQVGTKQKKDMLITSLFNKVFLGV